MGLLPRAMLRVQEGEERMGSAWSNVQMALKGCSHLTKVLGPLHSSKRIE